MNNKLYSEIEELAKTKNVARKKNKDKQSFGDFVEAAVIIFFQRHWTVQPIQTGRPHPFDFSVLKDGMVKWDIEVKAINNDWDLKYFLYEVQDRHMIPCHFGAMMNTPPPASKKEFFCAVDCNLNKGGTIHIYPARKLAQFCNTQPSRSTKVETRCVEVHWDKDIKGKRTVTLDEDIWECIKVFKGWVPPFDKCLAPLGGNEHAVE